MSSHDGTATAGPARGPEAEENEMDVLHVDCASCVARGPAACGDCVISVLLGSPPQGVELDDAEQAALSALADQGLVPPLRLVPGARRGRVGPSPSSWQDYA